MLVVSKQPAGIQPVYDIGVPETHNFVLANGLISHNCFNKSHSIAYSSITYICAWLKANYPEEFFCSLMTTRSRSLQPKDWAIKAPQFINEAKQLGVHIRPPSVNTSFVGFTIRDNEIYFGLNAIKGVGLVAAKSIIATRGKIEFSDIYDFISRNNLSKITTQTFQSLVKAGAFDRMGYRRTELLAKTNALYAWVKDTQERCERILTNQQRELENEQIQPVLERREELRRIQRLKSERDLTEEEEKFLEDTKGLKLNKPLKIGEEPQPPEIARHKEISLDVLELMQQAEYIGCYIGTHPASIIYPDSIPISQAELGENQSVAGVVNNIKKITDKNKNEMAFMSIGDGTGMAEVVIFASTYSKLKASQQLPETGELIEVYGKVQDTDPEVKMVLFGIQKYRSNT